MWAETVRKVTIAAIFAGNLLLEVIFMVVLRGWEALLEYGAKWGAYLPQNVPQILPQIPGQIPGQNLWQSHDSSRRPNPENP